MIVLVTITGWNYCWDKICRTKCEGGLGIRRTEDINAAFLPKQGWKILMKPDNIWVKLVNAKYLNNSSSFQSQ